MKILFIHQNFPGQFKHLAPALVAAGHQVNCLTMRENLGTEWQGVGIFPYKPARSSTPNIHPWLIDFETKIIRAEAVYRRALELKHQGYSPDLIISHPGWGESLFLHDVWHDAKIAMYCEFYYCAEGADVGFDPEFVPREDEDVCRLRLKNINNHLHFEQVIAGISPTHWQASTFPDFFRPRISVIHEGINTKILTPNADATITFANGVTIRKNDEIITFVSRNLEPYRGFHIFMRSLPELLKRRPNARILIIGNNDVSYGTRPANGGSWKDVMVQEISPLINPADWQRVNFLGNIAYDHFVAILQITRVHVYLTYPFVLSWSLLEAMSIGAAIIASDTVPLHEAIIDKQTGRLVDFFDIPAWVDQICALLDDEEQRRFLGANARQFAQAHYDLDSVCLPKQMAWIESLL